jgi:hypothetical protein
MESRFRADRRLSIRRMEQEQMSRSAVSLFVFSIYMFALGAMLVGAPNVLLSVFAIPETHEVWIRVVGMLVLIIGYLDFAASRNGVLLYLRWSVPARLSVPLFLGAFVLLGFAPPILILFGVIDAAAAIWTAVSLRREGLA